MKLISLKKVKNFTLIQFSIEDDKDNYFIAGKKSLIQLLDIPKNEAEYIINYCVNKGKGDFTINF